MGINFDTVAVHVRRLIRPQLETSFLRTRVLTAILASTSTLNKGRLTDPGTSIMWGGKSIPQGTRTMRSNSYQFEFRYQTAETDAAVNVTEGGNTPTATVFAEDQMDMAATRWYHFRAAIKIREDMLLAARGDLAIGSLIEDAVQMGFKKELDNLQTQLWTGTLTGTQQNSRLWPGLLGVRHMVDDGTYTGTANFYAGKDRTISKNAQLKANVVNAATAFPSTIPTASIIRRLRTEVSFGEIANKDPEAGKLVITTPELFNVLAQEVEDQHQIFDAGTAVPALGIETGFKFPMILKDNQIITYDRDCPAGEMYLLSPDHMTFESMGAPGLNFSMEEWTKKWTSEEGGGYYRWTNIGAMVRLTCFAPHLQTKVYGLTTT